MTPSRRPSPKKQCSLRFEACRVEAVFGVLDAVAWLNLPTVGQVAQFAGIDPRTAGKLLKNCTTIGAVEAVTGDKFVLRLPYPHKGSADAKKTVVREALLRMPLIQAIRQFSKLGEPLDDALRKAAVVQGIENYQPAALTPLLEWATQLKALDLSIDLEGLVDAAAAEKERRHVDHAKSRVVFLSHSSRDKPVIRQLATDLTAAGVTVWLDEQNIRVGDSIPESIAQGLASSDYFLLALSEHSVSSEWVKRELNAALVGEINRRKVHILPILLSPTEIPPIIADKKYADFTQSYRAGLEELLRSISQL
jgi:hypothetical protein